MDDLFQDNMLWPVRVVLTKRAGWSLWGGNTPDARDFLLPVGARYALFDTAEGLCEFLRRDRTSHVLADTFGWEGLRHGLRGRMPDVLDVAEFRFDRFAGWSPRYEGGGLVDCLDLIRDIGDQFGDDLLIGFGRRGGALRQLYDVLWGEAERVVKPERVAKAAQQAVARLEVLAKWNPRN
ncbi:hypothetical protein OHA72_40265 [Dactylosporangium sp. NBC_01737]|uniref:hypothetical protein n=1 Tax=Dactylosporangium sp. NBC_01737 TaxID=2975959 RepID=UPI002E15BB9D|nr:hypothetical protein OHA72_40265 [Dactylosporangium sp. NBC_01737]